MCADLPTLYTDFQTVFIYDYGQNLLVKNDYNNAEKENLK